jgi:hypothetical protein
MAIRQLSRKEKREQEAARTFFSEEGRDKITKLSSQIFIALEQRKQD